MVTKRVPYSQPTEYLFLDQKRKLKMVSRIKKNIVIFGLNIEDFNIDKMQLISNII